MTGEPMIVVEGVCKRFRRYRSLADVSLKTALVGWLRAFGRRPDRMHDPDRFDVIRDVSFTVDRGETVGFVGRNGSGKSTLLKMIAGIYRPDAGTIQVNGRVAALIELGAGFHPEFTGRENVTINGIILGLTKKEIEAKFDEIVEFSGIGDFLDAPVRTYSSGMFLRLAFAVAVHVVPEVLVIDEILAVGDEAFQEKCRRVIDERVRSKRHTTIIVTHDLEDMQRFCSRVIVFDPPHVRPYASAAEGIAEFRRMQSERAQRDLDSSAQALQVRNSTSSPGGDPGGVT